MSNRITILSVLLNAELEFFVISLIKIYTSIDSLRIPAHFGILFMQFNNNFTTKDCIKLFVKNSHAVPVEIREKQLKYDQITAYYNERL